MGPPAAWAETPQLLSCRGKRHLFSLQKLDNPAFVLLPPQKNISYVRLCARLPLFVGVLFSCVSLWLLLVRVLRAVVFQSRRRIGHQRKKQPGHLRLTMRTAQASFCPIETKRALRLWGHFLVQTNGETAPGRSCCGCSKVDVSNGPVLGGCVHTKKISESNEAYPGTGIPFRRLTGAN